jgi:hypothetical protein
MTALFNRGPAGDSKRTERAEDIHNKFVHVFDKFLSEIEEDGPVDLRDLAYVLSTSIESLVLQKIVQRRLGTD